MGNGINRYYLPAQQQVANTYVPIPYEEILMATQAQQKYFDDLEAKRQALEDTDFYALDPDLDYVTSMQNQMQSDVDKIADAYSTGDLRSAGRMYKDISSKWKKELNPLTGITGKAMANYDARLKYEEEVDKAIEKKRLNPLQKERAMAYFDEQYAKKGGVGMDPKKMASYVTSDIANWVNPVEWADKYGKDFKAEVSAFAEARPTGDGYIFKYKGTEETVPEEEIHAVLMKYASADPEMMHFLAQGEEMGYATKQMLVDAIMGAEHKYGYRKKTYDEDLSSDATYWKQKEEDEKMAAAKPISVTTTQTIENDRLVNTQREESFFMAGDGISGIKTFDEDVNNLNVQKEEILEEINELTEIAANPSSAPAAVAAARTKIKALNVQASELNNEIEQSKQYKESFIKNTYGIDNEFLAENGFESAAEYYQELKVYEQSIADVEQGRQEMYNRMDALNDKWSSIGTFSLNEEGNLEFVYDKGAGTKNMNLAKAEVSADIENFNTMQKALVEQPLEIIMEEGQKFNIKSKYNPDNHVASYNSLKSELTSKEKALNTNADFFINNRTYTSRQDIITPDMTKNNPTYQSIETFANNSDWANFRKVDESGNLVEYSPEMTGFDLFEFKRTSNKLVLGSIIHTRDNGSQPTFSLVNEEGTVLETGIMIDDANTSIKKELTKSYMKQAKYTLNSQGEPDGDAVVGIFASSDEPAFRNTWEEVNDAMNELPTEYITGDNVNIAYRKISGVGQGDSYFMGVDNVNDSNYIIFTKGVTEEQIQTGNYGPGDYELVPKSMLLPTALDYSFDQLDNYIRYTK